MRAAIGGFIAISGAETNVTKQAGGGVGGVTRSPSLAEFPSNGATAGHEGVDGTGVNADALALCTNPPDTSFTQTEPSPSNSATGRFRFTATVPGSTFECSLDGGAFAPCTSPLTTAALPDGSHTLRVRAVDPLGFRDPTPAEHTWVIDRTAPDTTIVTHPPATTTNPVGAFTFSSNESPVTYECSLDSGAYAPCSASHSTGALTNG